MSASNRRSRVLLQAIMATGVVAALALAARADLPITQIVATGDPAPDGGTYVSFGALISGIRQTPVEVPNIFAFQATTSNNVSGVYYYSYNDPAHGGNLLQEGTVADTTQTAPTGGTYSSFSSLSGGYGELGFIATDSGGNQGVYSVGQSSGGPILIATPQTLTPTGVPFGNFQNVSIMSDQYFGIEGGEIESDAGIYDFDSLGGVHGNQLEFTLVANTTTTASGAAGPFTSFGPVSFKNQIPDFDETPGLAGYVRAVQAAVGGVEGIYWAAQGPGLNTGGYVQKAQVGAATPDGTGHFTSFGNPVATSNETIFTAHYSTTNGDQQGIFAYGPYEADTDFIFPPGPEVHELVASDQVAPDSSGATFTDFLEINDSSYNTTFLASLSNGEEGLYVYVGEDTNLYNPIEPPPQLLKVIATGDMLDGKIVSGIELFPDGSNYYDLSSDYAPLGIDFEVSFTDGSESLNYFIVPEPGSFCLKALPLLLLRRRRSGKLSATQNGSMIEPLEQRRLLSSPALTPIGIDAVTDPTYGGLVAGSDDPTVEADNTSILNAAITAAYGPRYGTYGGVVYVPEGTYYFSGSIDLQHEVTLRGESATGENDGTNGTIIDYTGDDTAIKLKPNSNGNLWNVGVQNLTIESDGAGIGLYYPGDAYDQPMAVVRYDMENVKFETEGTAIDLPENDYGEAAQNSYFHNIYISVGGPESSDPETSIYLASGDEAVDLGGNANDIDGLTIGGTPAAGYSPAKGLIDIENSKVLLLKDINIPATFGSQSITDFYIYRGSNVAIQNVWINRAFAGSDTEPAGSNTEYEIIQCDVTIDSMALDSNDILDVDPAAEYVPASYHQPSIVVVDSLQFNTEDNTQTPTLADCIKANSISEVHVTLATQPYISSWPTGVDQPALDSSGALVPYEGVDVETADPTHVVSPNNSALMNHDYLQWWISTYPGMILYIPAGQYDISSLLTIPSGTEIEGEGEFSTTINCGDSAVLSLSNPGGGTDFRTGLGRESLDGTVYIYPDRQRRWVNNIASASNAVHAGSGRLTVK